MIVGSRSLGEKTFDAFNLTFLILLCCATLYPFIHVVSVAFSTQQEAFRPGLHLYPREVDTTAFLHIFQAGTIWNAYGNTLHRTIIGTVLEVLLTGMCAYALSKRYLPLRRTIFLFILITMYFNGGMVPNYLVVRGIGLYNSRWAMILPGLVAAFNVIVMKNFFQTIPDSIEESAKMDGASDFKVFFRIIIPLSMPVVATIALWVAVGHWNAYFDNLIYVGSKDKYVLQRMIRSLLIEADSSSLEVDPQVMKLSSESLKASTILVSTIPILMVYPFVQKYFIKGVMIGSVKS